MPGGTAGDVSVPELHVLSTAEGAARAAAGFLSSLSEECVAARGRFSIALSGGSTPRRLYQILASAPHVGSISWDWWQVFWGDERCVPPDHGDSNYRMARQALLDHVPVPPPQVHRIRGEVAPETAAGEYENEIGLVFQSTVASFDLISLGIGDDGHIASLFPGTEALKEDARLVVPNRAPHLQTQRVTFTLPLINSARAVAFLGTDGSKAKVVRQVLEPEPGEGVPPAAMVRPSEGALHWFLTEESAGLLKAPALEKNR